MSNRQKLAAPEGRGRAVQEWIGKTPDAKIPDVVRLRVILRYQGKDYLTGVRIAPRDYPNVEMEHIVPLSMGGEHWESNLAPTIKGDAHKAKSAKEAGERAKSDRQAKANYAIKTTPVKPIQSAGFAKSERAAKREPKASLPPRQMFE